MIFVIYVLLRLLNKY